MNWELFPYKVLIFNCAICVKNKGKKVRAIAKKKQYCIDTQLVIIWNKTSKFYHNLFLSLGADSPRNLNLIHSKD